VEWRADEFLPKPNFLAASREYVFVGNPVKTMQEWSVMLPSNGSYSGES
jgi:hypothetical protein